MRDQQVTFAKMLQYVKPGGHYIIEALHTSFIKSYFESLEDISTCTMLGMIIEGETGFSTHIPALDQMALIAQVDNINIVYVDQEDNLKGMTAVIKKNA